MTSEEWEILINEVDQVSMGFVRRLKKNMSGCWKMTYIFVVW